MLNIDWTKIPLSKMSGMAEIFRSFEKELNEHCPVLEDEDEMRSILKEKTTQDFSSYEGEELKAIFQKANYGPSHIMDKVPELVATLIKYWYGDKVLLELNKEQILGVYTLLERIKVPDVNPADSFKFEDVIYKVIPAVETLDSDAGELSSMDLWQLMEALAIENSNYNEWQRLAYHIALWYWEDGDEPHKDKVLNKYKRFMSLDVVQAQQCSFFLNSHYVTEWITLASYSNRLLTQSQRLLTSADLKSTDIKSGSTN